MLGEGGIHTIPVGLAEGTVGVRLPNGMGMRRDNLLGLGLLTGAGGLGLLGRSRVHTTVWGTRQGSITAWCTLTCHTLAGGLFTGLTLKLLDLEAQRGNFSEEGVHLGKLRK